jgi:hypothetical protein
MKRRKVRPRAVRIPPRPDPGLHCRQASQECPYDSNFRRVFVEPDHYNREDSGTNRMELRLWKSAGIQPGKSTPWYRDLGQGMGPTLNISAAMNAYTPTGRATWANFKNRQSLEILTEGDPHLAFDEFIETGCPGTGAEQGLPRCERPLDGSRANTC